MGRFAGLISTFALLGVIVVAAPSASAAAKKPHFYRLGTGEGPAITDGQRYVAFLKGAPSAAVYDFSARAPHLKLVSPPLCVHWDTPEAGALEALGAGLIGWNCSDSFGAPPALTDIATGKSTVLPSRSGIGGDGAGPVAIGRRWVEVFIKPHADPLVYWYYDATTNVLRPDSSSPRVYPNLDRAGLFERMCAPLRRIRDLAGDPPSPVYEPYFYAPPFGVDVRSPKEFSLRQLITVQRCGSRRVYTIGRCAEGCRDVGVSAGILTWADDRALHAYVLRTHKRFAWPTSDAWPVEPSYRPSLIHTRQRLIASIPLGADGKTWQILAARLPR